MPLRLDPAPDEGWILVARALDDLAPRTGFAESLFALRPGRRSARPIPIFTLELGPGDSRPPGDLLAAAERWGWRYIVEEAGQTVMVDLRGAEEALHINQVKRGPAAAGLLKAVTLAEELASKDEDVALRLLIIPSVRVEALWLASEGRDQFALLSRDAQDLVDGPEFIRSLQEAAALRAVPARAPDDVGGG